MLPPTPATNHRHTRRLSTRPQRRWLTLAAGLLWLLWVASPVVWAANDDRQGDDQYAVAAGHYAAGRWALAAEEFERLLESYPSHAQCEPAIFLLGESLLQLGRNEEAARRFDEYLQRSPQGRYARAALFRSGEAAYLLGRSDVAESRLQQFAKDYPDDATNAYVLTYQGELRLAAGDYLTAEARFRDSLQRYPQGPLHDDCQLGLARALASLDQPAGAEAILTSLAAAEKSDAADDAEFQLAMLLHGQRRDEEALAAFRRLVEHWPQSPWQSAARLGEGWILFRKGETAAAHDIFYKLVDDPSVATEARYWLALAEKVEGHDATAAELLLAAVERDPKHRLTPAMLALAGECLLRAGQADRALKAFEAVLAREDAQPWHDDAWCGKVQVAEAQSQYEQVDRLAEEFAARFPQSDRTDDVSRLRARSLLARKDWAAALRTMLRINESSSAGGERLEDQYLRAVAYEGLTQYEAALRCLDQVLQSKDATLRADAALRQGSVLMALGRYDAAIPPLQSYLDAGKPHEPSAAPDARARACVSLAICHAKSGRLAEAKSVFDEIPWSAPAVDAAATANDATPHAAATTEDSIEWARAVRQLAELALDAQDYEFAAALFRQAANHGDEDSRQRSLSGLAWSLYDRGHLDEAAEVLQSLLDAHPADELALDAHLLRGRILERQGELDAALGQYVDAIQLPAPKTDPAADCATATDTPPKTTTPPRAQALFAAARLCDRLQQHQQAVGYYAQLLRDCPRCEEADGALYDWAWSLLDLHQPDEAHRLFDRLVREYPASRFAADARYRLAEQAVKAGEIARAKSLLKSLTESDVPAATVEHALLLQGQIAAMEADWPGVEAAYASLLQRYPQSETGTAARFWIAESRYRRNDLAASEAQWQKLAAETPADCEPWSAMVALRLAQVAAQQRRWDEALRLANPIAAKHPGFAQQYEVDYLLGRCLHAQAQLSAARAAFARVIASPQGAKTETAAMAQWMIGETYFHQADYAAALREYLRLEILYAYPTWQAAALVQGGKCQEILGQTDDASKLYRRVVDQYAATPFAGIARERLSNLARQRPASAAAQAQKPGNLRKG